MTHYSRILKYLFIGMALVFFCQTADAAKQYAKRYPNDTAIQVLPATGSFTEGNCLETDASGNVVDSGSPCASGGTPGGSSTQIQYNNAGAFGGITGSSVSGSSVTFGSIDGTKIGASSAADATFSSVTLNNITQGVPFSSNGKLIEDSDFFYDDSVDELQAGFYTATKATNTIAGFNTGTGAAGVDYRFLKVDGQTSDLRGQWFEDEKISFFTSNQTNQNVGFVAGQLSAEAFDVISAIVETDTASISGAGGSDGGYMFIEARSYTLGGAAVAILTNDGVGTADSEPLGRIEFLGNNGSSLLSVGASVSASAENGETWTGSSSPGVLVFSTTPVGTDSSPVNRMSIKSDGTVVINDGGLSTSDVRVETDTEANMFVIDASADTVSFGNATTVISKTGTITSTPFAGGGDRFVVADNSGIFTVSSAIISSGTFTPTLTNVSNVSSSTAYQCQYLQVDKVVTVSGKFDIDPTSALSLTKLGISLPASSNFTATENLGGVASNISSQPATIMADTTNDRAQVEYTALDASATTMSFTFTYLIQ